MSAFQNNFSTFTRNKYQSTKIDYPLKKRWQLSCHGTIRSAAVEKGSLALIYGQTGVGVIDCKTGTWRWQRDNVLSDYDTELHSLEENAIGVSSGTAFVKSQYVGSIGVMLCYAIDDGLKLEPIPGALRLLGEVDGDAIFVGAESGRLNTLRRNREGHVTKIGNWNSFRPGESVWFTGNKKSRTFEAIDINSGVPHYKFGGYLDNCGIDEPEVAGGGFFFTFSLDYPDDGYALYNEETGQELWRKPHGNGRVGIICPKENRLLTGPRGVEGRDLCTGDILWKHYINERWRFCTGSTSWAQERDEDTHKQYFVARSVLDGEKLWQKPLTCEVAIPAGKSLLAIGRSKVTCYN